MKSAIIVFSLIYCSVSMGQIGGNQLYGNYKGNYNTNQSYNDGRHNKVIIDKTSMSFHVNILNTVQSTSFTITLGLNQEAASVEACNAEINKRITGFKRELKALSIKEEDIYVDFISQTKVYDYQTSKEEHQHVINIQQEETGFEIKKNILLRVKDIHLFDRLVEVASRYNIHNIVKVDYHSSELDTIYASMLKEARIISDKRKALLSFDKDNWEETPVLSIDFHHIQPSGQYLSYQAYESSDVSYINDYYRSNTPVLRQEQRKSKSYYFNKINASDFDKIMNADTPVVGIQCVMYVTVSYLRKIPDASKKQYHVITPDGQLKVLNLE
ncbi:SIMPL domain-containing protein [Fluviicola sp. SGL-29]|nr:SIMPL domain-containing protein [Fluviicola sp. SGL-29]